MSNPYMKGSLLGLEYPLYTFMRIKKKEMVVRERDWRTKVKSRLLERPKTGCS